MAIVKFMIGALFLSAGFMLVSDQTSRVDKPARYNHRHPKHEPIECSQCHVISPAKIEVRELPGHSTCVSCHNFAAAEMTFCGVCHSEQAVTKAQPALFDFPRPGIESEFGENFSHPSHLKKQPVSVECGPGRENAANSQCASCHQPAAQPAPGEPEMKTATGHAACFQCHCATPVKLPRMFDCRACHQLGGPQALSISGAVKEFKHADHEFDTRPRRKRDVGQPKSSEGLCAECHVSAINAIKPSEIKLPEAKNCAGCHNGRPGLPALLSGRVLEQLNK